jgi:type I restriction-modification system DNA methylase subunit
MKNERKTESLVRKYLKEAGYYDDSNIIVEEQRSDSPKINKLLTNASKKGNKQGYPEFIISSKIHSEFIIVIEYKADISKHRSNNLDCYSDYAVDGVLLYASFLTKEYDVLAIGVSGQTTSELRISHYLQLKGTNKSYDIFSDHFLPLEQYYEGTIQSDYKLNQDYDKLVSYARTLNELLQSKNIVEAERALLISGILISLRNDAFKTGFMKHKSAKSLIDVLYSTICIELSQSDIAPENVEKLKLAFVFIKENPALTDDKDGKQLTEALISTIDKEINGFVQTHKYFDAISRFYVEFLRYANADKGLGIVLTPRHVTDLFTELADVNKNSVVIDNCCGTGGFLISAMKKMVNDAKGDKTKEREIKDKQLVGIEYQPHIYALLISNMIVHRDGRTTMYPGDCFKESDKVKHKYSPTVGLLNPPYKTKGTPREELEFVLNNLSTLKEGGKCVAIVPMSCAIETTGITKELKRQLLQYHTLEAVMSMSEDLFHDQTNVVTCIMVFTAHQPHPIGKKTWFAYWRDDGLVKVKHRGRIDKNYTWENTKLKWVNAYRNRDLIDHFSLTREVSEKDEWCIEAYMTTEYSHLPVSQYEDSIKQHILFNLKNAPSFIVNNENNSKDIKLVELSKLFKPINGIASSNVKRSPIKIDDMWIPYVRPSYRQDTSTDGFVQKQLIESKYIFPKGTLYVSTDGQGSHSYAYVSVFEFVPNSNVVVLIPNQEMSLQEKLYYAWCITNNRYKFSYGRKPKGNRLKSIMLPETPLQPMSKYDMVALMNNFLNRAETA